MATLRLKILGSGAGGGFPQWNCACPNCAGFRAGTLRARARTQSQLAVSPDGGQRWWLLNASPDLRQQIEATRELWPDPARGVRHSPIQGAVITNGDLDHTMGLLLLRESQPLRIHATSVVKSILVEDNSYFRMLAQKPDQVTWTEFRPGESFELLDHAGAGSGIRCTPVSVGGKFPIYVPAARAAQLDAREAVSGLVLEAGGERVAYVPGLPALTPEWMTILEGCSIAFIDGTFWTEDEMRRILGGGRTATEMGHVPLSGEAGSLRAFSRLAKKTKIIYVHINNTNPVLNEDGPERAEATRAGAVIGEDGMELAP